MSGVFTIPAGADFSTTLAEGVIARIGTDPMALSAAIIYLPTRRAARGFGDAFAKVLGGATLLPQFRALGESEDDDFLFDSLGDGVDMPPAIGRIRRQLLLAHLIGGWHTADGAPLPFAQAAALAASLAGVMDEIDTQGADLNTLKTVVPAALAEHWQGVARFLAVIDNEWPALLAAEGASNPARRRTAVLQALADRLRGHPPDGLVIAAGSTGSIPATANLLAAIAGLAQGAVVLPGLDCDLDGKSWASLDPGHPQFGLKELLRRLNVAREDVRPWTKAQGNALREALLREALRPAPTTDAWRALTEKDTTPLQEGLNGLVRVNAATPDEEALTIALALREALQVPGRTAALVTPDRTLARRVATQMHRWGVTIDDSAGRPLAHMAAGNFLCLLAEAAAEQFAPVPLLALLKHPFTRMGQDGAAFRSRARELDRWCLRGPRPDPGLNGITHAIAKAKNAYRPPPTDALTALAAWWQAVADILRPLEALHALNKVDLRDLLTTHGEAAEKLAQGSKDNILWTGTDGTKAAGLHAELLEAAKDLPPIAPDSYAPLFRNLAMGVTVREGFGHHPRLAILGPLEARLQRYDLTVLGGLNEGSWPENAGSDPWFSRPMREALGLEQPERRIGQAAHDFAGLAAQPAVLLTRSEKAQGAPAIASRWLQRLSQLTDGLKLTSPNATDYARLARRLNEVPQENRITRPAPCPPVAARPARLSVTEIETWLRDPYAIYARHVLKLEPLNGLDQPVGPLERGTALHMVLERFVRDHPAGLPDDAVGILVSTADAVFAEQAIPQAVLALWRPRFLGVVHAIIAFEAERRGTITRSYLETKGELIFNGAIPFTLSGRADRIDILDNGNAAILDYKSGRAPSKKQVEHFLAPQLPLEAAMLQRGAFHLIGQHISDTLIYLSLADEKKARKPVRFDKAMDLAEEAHARLKARIIRFRDASTPYTARVLPFRTDSVGDYDHLARVREWSAAGGQDSGEGDGA